MLDSFTGHFLSPHSLFSLGRDKQASLHVYLFEIPHPVLEKTNHFFLAYDY